MAFRFDREQLLELAAEHHSDYVSARPFPHIVIDDFMSESVLDEVLAEFPSVRQEGWIQFESDHERKLASTSETKFGDATERLLTAFNSAAFIDFLEELTGIRGLVPDPYFEGGGLHQIVRGGHLNIHVDFNRHPRTGLERRLNVLLYLNRDWEDEYGGALELWGQDMERCEERILPQFNRMVVFSTIERSFHGHPEPLNCPEGQTRKSLALYYYSLPSGTQNGAAPHNTVWKARPGEQQVQSLESSAPRERMKTMVRRVAPPVLLDLVRAARNRSSSRA